MARALRMATEAHGRGAQAATRTHRRNACATFMNQAEVITQLQTIFDAVFLEPVVLTPAISAKDVPEWDSLMHISLMVSVEKAFNVRFRVGEVENAKNVGEFVNLIIKRQLEP
jgi:acyl carrier protein